MPDSAPKRLSSLAESGATPPLGGGVSLKFADPATRFILRGEAVVKPAGEAFGVAIPREAWRFASAANRTPDDWLLIASDSEVEAHQQRLESALSGIPHSLVDVSHRQTAVYVEGPDSAEVLNAAVPLDLSPRGFPIGMCVRTIFEKAKIVSRRTREQRLQLEVWRSFKPYVFGLLDKLREDSSIASRSRP